MKWLNNSRFSWRIKWFPHPECGCPTSGPKPGAGEPIEIEAASLWFLPFLFSFIWGPVRLNGGARWVVEQVKIAWLDVKARICMGQWYLAVTSDLPGSHQLLPCLRLWYKTGFNAWIKEGFDSSGEEPKSSWRKDLVFPQEAKISPWAKCLSLFSGEDAAGRWLPHVLAFSKIPPSSAQMNNTEDM